MKVLKLGKLPMQVVYGSITNTIGVVSSVFVLIIGLGYVFFNKTTLEQLNYLKIQEVTLKKKFEHKQHQASNLEVYRNQLKHMNDRFAFLLKQLPVKNEMPGLLEEITKTGVAAGLIYESFSPQTETTHDFYIELPIKNKVIGTYKQLALFLSNVAVMNRLVTLHEFSISKVPDLNKETISEDKLVMSITTKIYRSRQR